MKRKQLIILCCTIMLLTFGIVSFATALLTTDGVVVYAVKLQTSNETVGFNVDNMTLDFGIIPVGGMSKREFLFTDNFDWNETVFISVSGPAAAFVLLPSTTVRLTPHETQHFPVFARVQSNETINATYVGRLSIVYKRPISSLWGN